MDKPWFKTAMRKAGRTSAELAEAIGRDRAVISRIMNGHQIMTLDQAKTLATELNVALDDLMIRAGLADSPTAQVFKPGFSDSDAAAWVGQGADDRAVPTIAQALGARNGVDIWQIRTPALSLMGYMPGDYMLVDTLAAERARAGDVVVAQIYDNAKGRAVTVLRRFEPPVLVAASPDPDDRRVHVVDGVNVVVRGTVVASWRAA